MADELDGTQDERDLGNPENWSGNSIEQSLAGLEAAVAQEDEEAPDAVVLPTPPDNTSELEALRREAAALREGLQVRTRMEAERGSAPAPTPAAPAQPEYTEEQLNDWLQREPARASAFLASRIADARANNLDVRMSTMLKASAAIVEQQVAARHADAFADYGDEIREVVRQFSPENQIDPGAWDTAVTLVQGRHMKDIIAKQVAAEMAKQGETARAAQARSAGFSGAGRGGGAGAGTVTPKADQSFGLSAEQRKVADTMGVTYKEYAKYV